MKHLPKHLRPRWRYLGVEVETWPGVSATRASVQRHLWYAARDLLGDAGSARLDLTVLSADLSGGTGGFVIRVFRGEVERARAVVASLTEIDGDEIGLRVRGTAGTVRACEEKYMRRQRKEQEQRDVVFRDAERPASTRGDRVDVRDDGSFTGATTLDL